MYSTPMSMSPVTRSAPRVPAAAGARKDLSKITCQSLKPPSGQYQGLGHIASILVMIGDLSEFSFTALQQSLMLSKHYRHPTFFAAALTLPR